MEDKKHTGFILVALMYFGFFFLISLSSGEKKPYSGVMR